MVSKICPPQNNQMFTTNFKSISAFIVLFGSATWFAYFHIVHHYYNKSIPTPPTPTSLKHSLLVSSVSKHLLFLI